MLRSQLNIQVLYYIASLLHVKSRSAQYGLRMFCKAFWLIFLLYSVNLLLVNDFVGNFKKKHWEYSEVCQYKYDAR